MLIFLWYIRPDENKPLDGIFILGIFTLMVLLYISKWYPQNFVFSKIHDFCYTFTCKGFVYKPKKKKKSHTCEEGGAQLRISVCPLLMNLKNNYSFKKILKSANKNVRILILTILYFSKNIQKNTWTYHYFTLVYQKSWWFKVSQTEIGDYGSFSVLLTCLHPTPPFPPKTWKIRILKKW